MAAEWKLCTVYDDPRGVYCTTIWMREVRGGIREAFRCVASLDSPALETHLADDAQFRLILRRVLR